VFSSLALVMTFDLLPLILSAISICAWSTPTGASCRGTRREGSSQGATQKGAASANGAAAGTRRHEITISLFLAIHLSIYVFSYPIYVSIHFCIYLSVYLSICVFIFRSQHKQVRQAQMARRQEHADMKWARRAAQRARDEAAAAKQRFDEGNVATKQQPGSRALECSALFCY
jgi:hypothetical protein